MLGSRVRGNRLCESQHALRLGDLSNRDRVKEMIRPQLHGFADDARRAITTNPDYFVWWYTAKSIGLCVAVAALTFMLGRSSKECRR